MKKLTGITLIAMAVTGCSVVPLEHREPYKTVELSMRTLEKIATPISQDFLARLETGNCG